MIPAQSGDRILIMSPLPSKIAAGIAFLVAIVIPITSQNPNTPQSGADTHAQQGKQIFSIYCAGCHGLDASGTQRAPSLAAGSHLDRMAPADIRKIIVGGLPDRGMPSFRALDGDKLAAILRYLNQLRGTQAAAPAAGDPKKGEQLFFGVAECSSCHAVAGKGGFIAPELTNYAQSHSPAQTRAAITEFASRASRIPVVTVTTADGNTLRGVVRNEDNFSLQVQDLDGGFHFFSKPALKRIDREPASLMPSNYGQTLTSAQLDDLVSYLSSVKGAAQPEKKRDEDEE